MKGREWMLVLLLALPAWADWSLVIGGGGGDGAKHYLLGAEWQGAAWGGGAAPRLWFDSSYWQLADDQLVQLSLVPGIAYRAGGEGWQPFVFAGVGPAWSSQAHLEQRRFSTRFQFSSRAGIGLALDQHRLAIEGWHLSNGGIKQPNDGLSAWGVSYRYDF
ncbi:acyloxyacyl hydrolase [Zobellella taiwanensis]|jgi:lipid A 3-O-deacylase